MSAKARRLRNRLRIEREIRLSGLAELERRERSLRDGMNLVHSMRAKLNDEQAKLKRSVALRMQVERPFDHPRGDVFQLVIRFYPEEFKFQFRSRVPMVARNATDFAHLKAREAAHEIAKVIEDCIIGDPRQWEGL